MTHWLGQQFQREREIQLLKNYSGSLIDKKDNDAVCFNEKWHKKRKYVYAKGGDQKLSIFG